jgi:hypothetical protein
MYNHRATPADDDKSKGGKKVYKQGRNAYCCSLYQNSPAGLHHALHQLRSVSALVLETIRQVSAYARSNEEAFVEQLREASNIRQADTAKAHASGLRKTRSALPSWIPCSKNLWDFAAGRLNEKRFAQLSEGMSRAGRAGNGNRRPQAELTSFEADNANTGVFWSW